MKKFMKPSARSMALLGVLAVGMLVLAEPALANGNLGFNNNGKTIGMVATNVTASLKGFGPLITAICYIGALVFGLVGAMKWKAYGEQPDRTPLKIPIMFWAIAVLLAGFPEFMGTGITSLWGTGASVVSEPN